MSIELTPLQSIQLDLLKQIIQICEANRLRYYLLGGSALGAVRHMGFIPWDDDIDIGLPRKDFETLLRIAPRSLPPHLFLQFRRSEPEYPYGFAKLRNSETAFIESNCAGLDINHGIYLDLFPLDGAPTAILLRWLQMRALRALRLIVYWQAGVAIERRLNRVVASSLSRLVGSVSASALEERIATLWEFDNSRYASNWFGSWGDKEIINRAFFGEGRPIQFENLEVLVPVNVDSYLSCLYGDYMELPPEHKRKPHHRCVIISTTKSYRTFREKAK